VTKMEGVLHKALALSARSHDSFYALADHLAQLQRHDPDLWRRFLTESDMGRRKAYYLVKVWQQFVGLNLPSKRLEQIGWTKLQIIGRYINGRNAKRLLKLAEQCTAAELEARVRGVEAAQKKRCVMMYFTPEQYQQFEKALLLHGATRSGRGLRDKEEATISLVRRARQAAPMTKRHVKGHGRSK
jgi:hypothetical protein